MSNLWSSGQVLFKNADGSLIFSESQPLKDCCCPVRYNLHEWLEACSGVAYSSGIVEYHPATKSGGGSSGTSWWSCTPGTPPVPVSYKVYLQSGGGWNGTWVFWIANDTFYTGLSGDAPPTGTFRRGGNVWPFDPVWVTVTII